MPTAPARPKPRAVWMAAPPVEVEEPEPEVADAPEAPEDWEPELPVAVTRLLPVTLTMPEAVVPLPAMMVPLAAVRVALVGSVEVVTTVALGIAVTLAPEALMLAAAPWR